MKRPWRTPKSIADAWDLGQQHIRAGVPFPPSDVIDRWNSDLQVVYEKARLHALENRSELAAQRRR